MEARPKTGAPSPGLILTRTQGLAQKKEPPNGWCPNSRRSPAKSLTFSSFMENPLVGKKLFES